MLLRFLPAARTALKRLGLAPLIKRWLYPPQGDPAAGNPRGLRYRARMLIEQAFYASVEQVHDLPPIQGYWANRHLLPFLQWFGFAGVDHFFVDQIARSLGSPDEARQAKILSLGSGNCDFEVALAKQLNSMGYREFRIDCMDINRAMLARGVRTAASAGVGRYLAPLQADFNRWEGSRGGYRVVLANQALHHVVNLEGLFDAVLRTIGTQGTFVISDMIGRNGHMRWPEALEIVQRLWAELPPDYRVHRLKGTVIEDFENVDYSRGGFEGIRAQDILPLLIERFGFTLFIPFANVIDVFVDRVIGPNFDPDREWDRNFIDRVHGVDVEALRSGRIKPTHLMATLVADRMVATRFPERLSPAACVRKTVE
jgi:SAM-dependent methyltransferase